MAHGKGVITAITPNLNNKDCVKHVDDKCGGNTWILKRQQQNTSG